MQEIVFVSTMQICEYKNNRANLIAIVHGSRIPNSFALRLAVDQMLNCVFT